MNGQAQTGVNEIIQTVLDEELSLDLRSRDVALLVLIQQKMNSSMEFSFAMEGGELRSLAAKVDSLDVKDASGTEKRLTESINRLIRANCLARADLSRLRSAEDTEYQLTSLGDSIASWHVEHTRFSGEPLAAILQVFNGQIVDLHAKALNLNGDENWRREIPMPMQVVLKDMLVSVKRHQRELDRQHEALRAFIPTLLTENSEASIDQCEQQLTQVIRTIDDLQEVTLSSSSKAFELLYQIEIAGENKKIEGVGPVCQDITRRMHSIVQWTAQRATDWVEHHGVVHDFLRSVVRIDRQRRLTEALKHAIAIPPDWSLLISREPRLIRMREDVRQQSRTKSAPRQPRRDYAQEQVPHVEDELPVRLRALLDQKLAEGEARWSEIVTEVIEEGADPDNVFAHLSWLMGEMVRSGKIDAADRGWVPVASGIRMEELRITAR
jgi:chromosome partition protein MukF